MVAKVNSGKNIVGILNYNENKVKAGKAECFAENMFGAPTSTLTFYEKLRGFENYLCRNKRATTNAIHISLNFHSSESLSRTTLKTISYNYMQAIGFAEQPYLVYEHFDASHQHLHIVTTNITSTGKRISIHNIGKDQSEKARKQIEQDFNLVRAERNKEQKATTLQKVVYGKSESRQSVSNVVQHVVRSYKYTSLPELNAALRQFNVMADRGNEKSLMFQRRGILYRIIGDNATTVGVPFKASSLPSNPTLSKLEKLFKRNEVLRIAHKVGLAEKVSRGLQHRDVVTMDSLIKYLSGQNIYTLLRTNAEGRVYGITFVDNNTRTVFNGSELGKTFSASAIQTHLSTKLVTPENNLALSPYVGRSSSPNPISALSETVNELINAQPTDFSSPEAALRLRRRKKKKSRSI